MDEKEQELVDALDSILEEVRKLRESLDDPTDAEDAEDAEAREDGEEKPTDEEVLDKIDSLMDDYDKTERKLEKHRKRNARLYSIHTRHSERATQNDRIGAAPIMPHSDARNRGKHTYNVGKAISEYYAQKNGEGHLTGLEAETQIELRKARPGSAGLILPFNAPYKTRTVDMTANAGAISTDVYPTIIDVMRNQLVLAQLGTQFFEFERATKLPAASDATTFWGRSAPTKSSPGLSGIEFTPYQVGSRVTIDRGALMYSQVDAQGHVINLLIGAISQAIQAAAFHGTGSSNNQPLGLFGYTSTDVNVVPLGTNGAALDRAKLLSMVAGVNTANAPDQTQAFVTTSKVVGKLEGTAIESGFPAFLYEPVSKTILGRPAAQTNSISDTLTKGTSTSKCSAIAFGAWSETAVATFGGGIEVYLDPISGQDGSVTVTVLCDADFQLLHGKAISIATDVLAD